MMNYCSIEEAWGDNYIKENRKKKRNKENRLYNSQFNENVHEISYQDGLHDNTCMPQENNNFSVKNRLRHKHGRKSRKIPSKTNRKYTVSYDDADMEYNNYKKETRRVKKSMKNNKENMLSGYSDNEVFYNITDDEYNDNNDKNIKNSLMRERENEVMEENEENEGMEEKEYFESQNVNMDLIEGFEGNQKDLDSHNIENKGSQNENKNVVDALLDEKMNSLSPSINNNSSDSELSDTDDERDNVITVSKVNNIEKKENENKNENSTRKVSKKDIDYRLNSLNRSVNMIMKQMNNSHFFDDQSEDNIHDLILFILFGIFIIFILDSIYRLGKQNSVSTTY